MYSLSRTFQTECSLAVIRALSDYQTFHAQIKWMRSDDRFTLDDIAKAIAQQHQMIDGLRKYEERVLGKAITEYVAP